MSTPHTAPRTAQSGGAEESRIHGGEGVDYSRPGLVGYLSFPQGAVNLRRGGGRRAGRSAAGPSTHRNEQCRRPRRRRSFITNTMLNILCGILYYAC